MIMWDSFMITLIFLSFLVDVLTLIPFILIIDIQKAQ